MTLGWWIAFGALGGVCVLGFAAALAAHWSQDPLIVGSVMGLIAGGFLGSRAHRMGRRMRTAIGALLGAAISSTFGGFLFLFGGLALTGDGFEAGKDFVIGAIVGGVAGVVPGGLLGGSTAGSNRGDR